MLIGLMGKSGSGKTLIGNWFKELDSRIQVIDVDKVGHKSHTDDTVKERIRRNIGNTVFNQDGSINRKKLSDIVFNDEEKMKALCDATYWYMVKEIDQMLKHAEITILDYALLPKTKYFDLCDLKILVEADYTSRSARVVARDNISTEKYDQINSNSLDYSNLSFDYIITNNSDLTKLRKVVGEIYEKSIVSG